METRYYMYLRKSSEGTDKQAASLPAQEKELKDLVDSLNLKVIKIYRESQSAHHRGRPLFNEMLSEIQKSRNCGIIVWNLNRIARNSADAATVIELMDDGYIDQIVTPNRVYKNNSDDKANIGTDLVMSKKYSDALSESVKRGNKHKFLERKLWNGPAKQGYLNVIDPITREKTVTEDKDRLPLIEKAFKLYLSGSYTAMEVLDMMNNDWNYRTRKTSKTGAKPLNRSGFYRMLNDPYYYGLMVRREGSVMGSHKAIITRSEYDKINMMLGARGSHFTRHEFPYKELLRCGECESKVTAEIKIHIICGHCREKFSRGYKTTQCPYCGTKIEDMKNHKILSYTYYHCTKKSHPNCTQGSILLENLEKQVTEELSRFAISEKFKNWAIQHLNELNDIEVIDREAVRRSQQQAYDDCVKRIDNLLQMKISPQNVDGSVISEEEYITQRKSLMSEKEDLIAKINMVDARINNWLELSEKTFNFARYSRYWFQHGDLKTKTQILATLGSKLTIKDKKLCIDGQKPFYLIERGLDEMKEAVKEFETIKEVDLTIDSPVFADACRYWLGDRDSNPNRRDQNPQSYR